MKTLPRLPEDFIKNLPGSKVKLIDVYKRQVFILALTFVF